MTSPLEFQRRTGHAPSRRSTASFVDLAGLLALVVALVIGLPAYARTEGGRARIAALIEQGLSDGIRGSVTIGSVDRADLRGLAATDVVFRDESGRPVLQADSADLEIDWSELFAGHFVSPRGTVHGGRVWIETLPSGELLIDRAFEAPTPGPPGQPVGADLVRLERLAASDIEVIVGVVGAPGVRATHVSTICIVRAPENGSARFRADRIDATVRIDAPIPIELAVEDGTFELDGASRRRAHIVFPSEMGGEPLEMVVRIRADQEETMHVSVVLAPESVGAVLTGGPLLAQALLADAVSGDVDVRVEMP